jgi:hypothetical protein
VACRFSLFLEKTHKIKTSLYKPAENLIYFNCLIELMLRSSALTQRAGGNPGGSSANALWIPLSGFPFSFPFSRFPFPVTRDDGFIVVAA